MSGYVPAWSTGPTCFYDRCHPFYQFACQTLGLLEADAHWDRTLEEATISDSPQKIRQLFAVLSINWPVKTLGKG
jgi:hypothetical protein